MSSARFAVVAVAGLMMVGCGGSGLETVRAHAATAMNCDASRLKLTPDKPESTSFTVEGCGQIARFWVRCSDHGCSPDVYGSVISPMLTKQAAFDLKCPVPEVQLSQLSIETFGAKGCGRQASYLLVDCAMGTCRAIQNTQAQ